MKAYLNGKRLINNDDMNSLFITKNVLVNLPTNGKTNKHIEIAAPTIPGYKFLFWISPSSVGDVINSYIEDSKNPTTKVWIHDFSYINDISGVKMQATAVYIKQF